MCALIKSFADVRRKKKVSQFRNAPAAGRCRMIDI
jgi:hypothetical protein